MIHENKDKFLKVLNQVAMQTGFLLPLLEKDYFLTLMISHIHELSENLIFKGGTCLNKIYFSYYRLSEDLDFSMRLPKYRVTRSARRRCIQPVKDSIEELAKYLGMRIDDSENPGRNESRQYVFHFIYQSLVLPQEAGIKLEIGLRYNPLCAPEKRKVRHNFLHSFTDQPLFDAGEINCLALNELIAEKIRAATTRRLIAPRDFYDIDYVLRSGFKISDPVVMKLLQDKLAEDNADTDLSKYSDNLGRTDKEIRDMKSRIKEELFDVLTPAERKNFNIDSALSRINLAMAEGSVVIFAKDRADVIR